MIVGEAKSQNYLQQLVKYIITQKVLLKIFLSLATDQIFMRSLKFLKSLFHYLHIPEAFGRTVIESIKLGVPVIGYDHGGVGEQLKHVFPSGLTFIK